jgi:hypothetical protein
MNKDVFGTRKMAMFVWTLCPKLGPRLKGCVHLRHDLRYDLRFGACVIMTMW